MCSLYHLIFIWIFHEHTFFHAVRHNSIAAEGRYMGSNHRKHLRDEWVKEATDTAFLHRTKTHFTFKTAQNDRGTLDILLTSLVPPVMMSSLW